jgi:hypothetical protein
MAHELRTHVFRLPQGQLAFARTETEGFQAGINLMSLNKMILHRKGAKDAKKNFIK